MMPATRRPAPPPSTQGPATGAAARDGDVIYLTSYAQRVPAVVLAEPAEQFEHAEGRPRHPRRRRRPGRTLPVDPLRTGQRRADLDR
jgi:hypothetical protein